MPASDNIGTIARSNRLESRGLLITTSTDEPGILKPRRKQSN